MRDLPMGGRYSMVEDNTRTTGRILVVVLKKNLCKSYSPKLPTYILFHYWVSWTLLPVR